MSQLIRDWIMRILNIVRITDNFRNLVPQKKIVLMMNFDQDEKLAVVKAIAETIELDEKYKVGELMYLDELMETLDFNMQFVEEAKALSSIKAVSTLRSMTDEKKKALIIIIDKMTEADGAVHKKETDFVVNLVSILQ